MYCVISARGSSRNRQTAEIMGISLALGISVFILALCPGVGFAPHVTTGTVITAAKASQKLRADHYGRQLLKHQCQEYTERWFRLRAHPSTELPKSNPDMEASKGLNVDGARTILEELLDRCKEATRSKGAMESSHTGSSEWAGFRTTPELLQGVSSTLARIFSRSRRSDGTALCWSWLTLAPQPSRIEIASDPRFSIFVTVLPAGNGSPPSHRPIFGSQIMSRVLSGEVEQVKANSQRIIGRSHHSTETPVWSSYGGGVRRLVNEGFQPAVVLEVVFYDWSRGSGYIGGYAAMPSGSGNAERLLDGQNEASGGSTGTGESEQGRLLILSTSPCDPHLLLRDGDIYEEEEEGEGGETGEDLILVRRDG
ncbi:unnamed protein product, partial [Choristocarpus tenellus]